MWNAVRDPEAECVEPIVEKDAYADAKSIQSLEHVLQNINKLNRSLEGVIAVRWHPPQCLSAIARARLNFHMLIDPVV